MMKSLKQRTKCILLFLILITGALSADILELTNGDRISGTIISLDNQKVRLQTSYGTIEIPRGEIARGEFGEPAVIIKETDSVTDASGENEAQVQISIPRSGLILECLFDSNLQDSSGNDQAVKKVKDIFFMTGMNGKAQSAVLSNGTGTYLEVANTASLSALNSFTFSAWVLFQAEKGNQYLVAKWEKTMGQEADGKFAVSYGNCFIYFYIVDETGHYHGLKTNPGISIKTWYHLVVYFQAGIMAVYLDGKKLAEQKVSAEGLFEDKSPVYLMTAKSFTPDGWSYHNLVGQLDNVRLYNRRLTEEEIEQLYREGKRAE